MILNTKRHEEDAMGTLAIRVSAALRQAELPVLRYEDRMDRQGRQGIRVGNESATAKNCCVFFRTDDEEEAKEWSDKSMAVLIARGFEVDRHSGHDMLTVRNGSKPAEEDVHATVASSDLDISQPTPSEWHVKVDGHRGAYSIKRTGKDARTRYAVHSRREMSPLARNLRTMQEAIDVVKQDMQ